VVQGLVTAKQGELASVDALVRSIQEAAKAVLLDQLCGRRRAVSPAPTTATRDTKKDQGCVGSAR
jgi:hypothetical protein